MAIAIIDRRKNPKGKSLVNRQRFLKRHSRQMRDAIREKIRAAEVKTIASNQHTKIKIDIKATEQPVFHHRRGGTNEQVLPGNREFVQGDTISRPPSGAGGKSNQGTPEGESEDAFVFEISQEEFLHYFFDGLALPDLVKRALIGENQDRVKRTGFATDGPPNNLDLIRTMRQSQARRLAFRLPKQRRKRELEAERDRLEVDILSDQRHDVADVQERLDEVREALRVVDRKIKTIPFLDEIDIRYRRHEQVPVPVSQAVMFCLMDVSGSMGEWEKEMAKHFFMLLYLFLSRNYEKVDLVFIRHHHDAKEVDEEEFFRSRESGGTIVSTALHLMQVIIDERYPPSRWNIYGCQASDGDNFASDLPVAQNAMVHDILPLVQYFAYVEVDEQTDSQLWPVYEAVQATSPKLAMARITDATDIYPVFRGLFEASAEGMLHGQR
jgi:uncharacterized sporulation protein YeaH/YhbH (DUF444 family)